MPAINQQVSCPKCEEPVPAGMLVCPACRAILAPPTARRKTPPGVIIFLVFLIAVLLVIALVRSYQVFVMHQY